jgi:C-terminal processing protease CtpA/Prc
MTGDYDSFFRFLDSAFRDMRAKDIRHLAIDLRHNTGGNSRFGDILLAYITDQKFALSGKKKWKVSRRYKAHLLSGGDSSSVYHKQPDGSIWEIGECGPRERLVRQDTIYNGKVYFLTGPLTFSSANMLADGAKQYKLATLVGEPTGESTNDFGETYTFTLPNSRLQITTTTSFDIGVDCDETHTNAVAPDIYIKQSVQHLLDGRDPVLEYVMKQASMLQSSASGPTPGAKKSLP